MFEIASQIIICLILATLLGWVIGYLMGKATSSEKNEYNEDNTHELQEDKNSVVTLRSNTKVRVGTQPILLTAAREGGKDNLQLIKGLDSVMEELLNETGIYHFDQIANLSKEEISWLNNSMSFPDRIEREDWVTQAKNLAISKKIEF